MENNRERLGSRLGFIMLSAGCAIGCGNVWKFPWMTGQNGGGSFVLIYILCLLLLGFPAMTMELAIGRAAQASPVRMYHMLEKPGKKWHIHGYMALLGNIALMSFYTVVTGWMIYYCLSFMAGRSAGLGFDSMISDPFVNVIFMLLAVAIGFGVLCFNLRGGLERVTKYMMLVLLTLMVILACVREITGWKRPKGCFFCGIGIALLSLTTALGYSVLHFHPFGSNSSWLDFWDFIVSTNLLPLGALVISVFCCYNIGWGWDSFIEEANTGKGLKVRGWMKPIFKYFVPACIAGLYIYGLFTFNWS